MPEMSEEEYESAYNQALDLARIIETFVLELVQGGFMVACECCSFPVPAPFVNENEETLCRPCRLSHDENGEHIA